MESHTSAYSLPNEKKKSLIYNSKQHFTIFAHLNRGTYFSEYATEKTVRFVIFRQISIHSTFREWSNRDWRKREKKTRSSSSRWLCKPKTKQMNSNECRQTNKKIRRIYVYVTIHVWLMFNVHANTYMGIISSTSFLSFVLTFIFRSKFQRYHLIWIKVFSHCLEMEKAIEISIR